MNSFKMPCSEHFLVNPSAARTRDRNAISTKAQFIITSHTGRLFFDSASFRPSSFLAIAKYLRR